MTPELAARLGLGSGARGLVITDVDPAGAAAEAGLQPGDVIEQVNRQPVRSMEDLKSALSRRLAAAASAHQSPRLYCLHDVAATLI